MVLFDKVVQKTF